MKYALKILLILPVLMAFTQSTSEGPVKWYSFNEGFEAAHKEGKIAVIDCYTDWCGWCKKMDKNTFGDPEISKRLNEDFIAIKFNPEKPGKYFTGADSLTGKQLLMALSGNRPSGYPTLFFFVPQFNKMFQVPGYQDPAKFTETLNTLEGYQKKAN